MCIIQFVCDETRERKCILYIFEYDATLGETMYMIHFVYDATRGRQCILYILYTQHEGEKVYIHFIDALITIRTDTKFQHSCVHYKAICMCKTDVAVY